MESFENFLYELRPYLFLGVGIYALTAQYPNVVAVASALILLFCGMLVLHLRFQYRKGSTLGSFIYQSRPFFFLGLGIFVLIFKNDSMIAVGSALLLLFASTVVLRWRYRGRRYGDNEAPVHPEAWQSTRKFR